MRISDWSSDVCSSDLKEDVRFDAESLGNLVKPIDTYAVLSPLQSAHISPVDSSDIGQSLLREPAGRSQQPQVLCKIISARHRTRWRSEEHTSELQSLMRISYAVLCSKKIN